jgi:hypothetical protein
MKKFKFLICISLALLTIQLSAQLKYNVSGLVSDSVKNEPIIGDVIRVQELKSTGTVSDFDGTYLLQLPHGKYVITAHVIGLVSRSHAIVR